MSVLMQCTLTFFQTLGFIFIDVFFLSIIILRIIYLYTYIPPNHHSIYKGLFRKYVMLNKKLKICLLVVFVVAINVYCSFELYNNHEDNIINECWSLNVHYANHCAEIGMENHKKAMKCFDSCVSKFSKKLEGGLD